MGSAQVKPSSTKEILVVPVKSENEENMEPNKKEAEKSGKGGEGDAVFAREEEKAEDPKAGKQAKGKDDGDDDDGAEDNSKEKKEEKTELTPEEMEAFQDEHIARFEELIKGAQAQGSLVNETGEFHGELKAVVMMMYRLYFQLTKIKKVPLSVLIRWRQRVASLAIETKTMDMLCEIIKQTYPASWLKEDGHLNYLMKFALLTLQNFCDASGDFAVAVANYPGLCEKIKEILLDRKEEHINQTQSPSKEKLTQWSLSLFHNLSMAESNIGRLREVDILQMLVDYLASPKNMFRLTVFATLSAIINEKESEIIQANKDQVSFLLEILSNGLKTQLHRHNGWSCKECTLAIRYLARNDANKKLLVELGALDLLVKLGNIGNQEEQYEAVSALWALCFDTDNSKKICNEAELGVVDLFLDLKNSDDKRISKACEGALWTIRGDLKSSSVQKYRNTAESASQHHSERAKSVIRTEDDSHIMISYQWADQQTLIVVRNKLRAAGFKVWMDIDQMGGSTVEAMASAVEEAKVVLMCMSQKYKNSPNCRAEAEYAFQKQRQIIPLKMERGYVPDGWLGFICGAKLFFDFSGKYSFDDKMEQLLREIAGIFGGKRESGQNITAVHVAPVMAVSVRTGDQVDSSPIQPPVASVPNGPFSSKTIHKVRQWKAEDVQKWIEKNDLKQCGVSKLTGGEVALLFTMYLRAPDYFFKCLQDMLGVKDLLSMSKIVWALEDLSECV